MSIRYPCEIAPGGVCPDCTNDGPLCEFDTCIYEEELFGETDQRMKASFDSVMKKDEKQGGETRWLKIVPFPAIRSK